MSACRRSWCLEHPCPYQHHCDRVLTRVTGLVPAARLLIFSNVFRSCELPPRKRPGASHEIRPLHFVCMRYAACIVASVIIRTVLRDHVVVHLFGSVWVRRDFLVRACKKLLGHWSLACGSISPVEWAVVSSRKYEASTGRATMA